MIVEVAGNAPPFRFLGVDKPRHDLRLALRSLGSLPFRHVRKYKNDAADLTAMQDRRCAIIDGPPCTVFRNKYRMIREAHHGAGREHLFDRILDRLSGLLVYDAEDLSERALDGLFRPPAGHMLRDWIHKRDVSQFIGSDNAVADARQCHMQQITLSGQVVSRVL